MKKFKSAIKWAIIFNLVYILWMIAEKSAGLHDTFIEKHAIYTNLFLVPHILVYVLAVLEKKKELREDFTFLRALGFGFVLSVVTGLLSPLTISLTLQNISPDYLSNMITYVVNNNIMSHEQAEAYFNLKTYMLQGAFGNVFFGITIGFILALIFKNGKVNFQS